MATKSSTNGRLLGLAGRLGRLNYYQVLTLRDYLSVFGLALLFSLFVVALGFMAIGIDPHSLLLLFAFAIVLSVWNGNLNSGIISIIITSLGFIRLNQPAFLSLNPDLIVSLVIYLCLGAFISYVISNLKRIDQLTPLKQQNYRITQALLEERQKNTIAQEEIHSRDEFASIASHELKTPLTLMLLQIQTALNNIRNVSLANFSVEDLMKKLESVEHQTTRLSKMISDLSNTSLITTGKLKLEKEEVDLSKVTRDAIERLPSTLDIEGKYPIDVDIKEPVVGFWDRVRIEQVIINLVTNAIKYGDNKPINIKLQRSNGRAKLIVKDNGIGIPKEAQQKIFNKFERGSASSSNYRGLGVGLYITNLIVAAHGGQIKVDSKENHGSTFTVELPVRK